MCRLTPPCVEQTGWLDRYLEYESRVRVTHLMNGHVFGRYEYEMYGGQLRCSALLATSPPSSQSSKSPTTCSGVCQLFVRALSDCLLVWFDGFLVIQNSRRLLGVRTEGDKKGAKVQKLAKNEVFK